MPSSNPFTTVRSEGGLLPPDLLARIVAGDRDLGGVDSTGYGLGSSDRLGEAASRAWNRAKAYWQSFAAMRESLRPDESGVTETREQWIFPLLRELGFDRPEFRAAAVELGGRRYPIQHRSGPVLLHIVSFRQVDLDRSVSAGAGQPRVSPHGLLQEYLNRSDESLHGLVTNGLTLRLLRDNLSLSRLAYVEFDLQGMFEGGVYADFVLLFLTLHRTRFPREGEEASSCWLEKWREKAESQGTRALGALRVGVENAIQALGNGLLAHPTNGQLRVDLQSGALGTLDFYAELLRVIYRLIFLFVAEERDLLHPDGSRPNMKARYRDYYSATRLRDVARRHRTDERHDDLWRSIRITFDILAGRRAGLDLVALEGLFAPDSCPNLDQAQIANSALSEAVLQLGNVRVNKRVRRVNYRDIGAEELGGVYEGLLDKQPRITGDAPPGKQFEFIGSGERKSTGSYYTPDSLVLELIKSALVPVIEDRLSNAGKSREAQQEALLSITVCDTACGSGHFLVAAARRLGAELARIRADDREPGPKELRSAQRDVVRHCIYGVDVNPLSVDLCRLSLWMESYDSGRPLSFLDHHVKVGNSLIGATPELVREGLPDGALDPVGDDDKELAKRLKKRNREERRQAAFVSASSQILLDWETVVESLASESRAIAGLPDTAAGEVRAARHQYQQYVHAHVDPVRQRQDAWTAAFFWPIKSGEALPPTTNDLRADSRGLPIGLTDLQRGAVHTLALRNRFFHWQLEFPEVFERSGFDCVLGNPPWEKVEMDEVEFFATRDPAIANLAGARRKEAIEELRASDPTLWNDFQASSRRVLDFTRFTKGSGRFALTGSGRINLYALFAEHDRTILGYRGRAGVIVPTGIATDDSTKAFFQSVADDSGLATLFDFENRRGLFPDVDSRMKFCLLTLSAAKVERGDLAFFLTTTDHLRDDRRRFQLSAEDFALLNPNTRTCPVFRTRADTELTRRIYRRVPVLADERRGLNPWHVEFMQGLFNMTSDSKLFRHSPGSGLVPLYEAKLFHQFNHRWATYERGEARDANPAELADPAWQIRPRYWVEQNEVETRLRPRAPRFIVEACLRKDERLIAQGMLLWFDGYQLNHGKRDLANWFLDRFFPFGKTGGDELHGQSVRDLEAQFPLTEADVEIVKASESIEEAANRIVERRRPEWLVAFRDIARTTDERTAIFSVLPRAGVGHTAPLLIASAPSPRHSAALLGSLNSLTLDYVARQKVGGTHLTYSYLNQFPVLPPSAYASSELDFIVPRVRELIYTSWDLRPFAEQMDYDGEPFTWDMERRALQRAELDAYYASLYGISRDELRYILDPQDVFGPDFPGETFRVLKEREVKEFGEYRTRRLVLEAWDRLGLEPRNRDGRYEANPPPNASGMAPSIPIVESAAAKSEVNGSPQNVMTHQSVHERARTPARSVPLLPAQEHAPETAVPPSAIPPARTVHQRPAPPDQPPSPPGRPQLQGFSGGTVELRARVLKRSLDALRGSGPLSGREIAQRLVQLDKRIDRHLVNSVLSREGAQFVRHDSVSGKYRIKTR